MDKQDILNEIRRCAEENDGKPVGREVFKKKTGITIYDWQGVHWATWSEAIEEAGYQPDTLTTAYKPETLIDALFFLSKVCN
jgi:hypothetical protein